MASDTKTDPWALLRDARESLDGVVDSDHPVGMSNAESRAVECIKRIDAALAAHEAEERVEVRWRENEHCDDEFKMYEAYPDDHTGLDVVRFKDGKWRWTACREVEEQGYCNTLDEAKSAAIAAARGMR